MSRFFQILLPGSPHFRLLLTLVFALHAALGAAVGLSVDEAHYALYAAHLDWSYFDHPPMVGWLQWPLVALHAPDAVLRLLPGLLWLLTMAGVYHLTLRMAPADAPDHAPDHMSVRDQAAVWSVLVLLLAPLLHILGIGLLPDTLLMLLTVALMHQTLTLVRHPDGGSTGQWLVMGVLLGLSGLSKYTAVLEAVAVIVCVLQAHGWRLLRRGAVWGAVVVALVLIVPVLAWNAQNHWISFVYQAQHGAGSVWQAAHVARFLVVQLVVFGPLLLWGVGVLVSTSGRTGFGHGPMVLFCVVPLAVLTYLSGGGSSLPHWTAPAWVALAPFAGWGLASAWHTAGRGARAGIVGVGAVQGLLSLALPALMLTGGVPFLGTPLAQITTVPGAAAQATTAPGAAAHSTVETPNPFADVHGWQAVGARVQRLAQERNLSSVSVQNWTLASRIGWYARPMPVHVLEDRFDQFDLWAGDLPVGADTLLLDWSQMAYVTPLGEHGFERCELLETVPVDRMGRRIASFSLYDCRNWQGNPQPRLRADNPAP